MLMVRSNRSPIHRGAPAPLAEGIRSSQHQAPSLAKLNVEAGLDAVMSASHQDVTFSLELTQDQKDTRDCVHGFAADVVRPAAHEGDEKEQTP
jgi:hypothetical protein